MVYKRELEKQIAELENKIADIKANCDYVLEGKEIEYREERKKLCADFENMKATLESKIAELEQQIEKMKCCGNCSHRRYWGNELNCKLDLDKQFECDNNNKKYWEFREE